MFRIRKINDTFLPINKKAIEKVQDIAREQIPDITDKKIPDIPDLINNPFIEQMRYTLFVADDARNEVKGFALMSHDPKNRFCYLDLIAIDLNKPGGGIGGALYQRIREEAANLDTLGIFFECLSDIKNEKNTNFNKNENIARLRFYERYGARPIDKILYESISRKHYQTGYFLMFDPLGKTYTPDNKLAKKMIKLFLDRKYAEIYSTEEINMILESIQDDPIHLKPSKYLETADTTIRMYIPEDRKIVLVYSDEHKIHHIRERGYVESPVRVEKILKSIMATNLFRYTSAKKFPASLITEVHSRDFYEFLKMVSVTYTPDKSLYPDVFPIRHEVKKPGKLSSHVGYYCIDIYSPINRNSFIAARKAVDCSLTAASALLYGSHLAYALVRPPGHHAGKGYAGGFCYLNSTAIAANFLSKFGKVAILDIDYHHGNGQQEIFYERADVLTVSIHANPEFEYPYFSGYEDETGAGPGAGFNLNLPLKRGISWFEYRKNLRKALLYIINFRPDFLIIAFGLDSAKGDPTGTWQLTSEDFLKTGELIGKLQKPLLVIQEGGYDSKDLGKNAASFFTGLWNGVYK